MFEKLQHQIGGEYIDSFLINLVGRGIFIWNAGLFLGVVGVHVGIAVGDGGDLVGTRRDFKHLHIGGNQSL